MKTFKFIFPFILLISFVFLYSCRKDDDQNKIPEQKEISSDKEKELKDKEEFLRIKEQQLREWEDNLNKRDSAGSFKKTDLKDSTKVEKDTTKVKQKKEDKKTSQKEKELNKRLDNPITCINDYLEYIKRGISDDKTFDANMKKASETWESRSADSFKKSYKSTKKFIITQEPQVVSQKGSNASVKVKVKQTQKVGNKEEEKEITVTYNLVADQNGNWKIKSNVVK